VFTDYYAELSIPTTASQSDIKAAYRDLARRWHPDVNRGKDTTPKMQRINEAYLILGGDEARARYDREYQLFCQWRSSVQHAERAQTVHAEPSSAAYDTTDEVLINWMDDARSQAMAMGRQALSDVAAIASAAGKAASREMATSTLWVLGVFVLSALLALAATHGCR
jgi:curved DNA-binding protein CbpA